VDYGLNTMFLRNHIVITPVNVAVAVVFVWEKNAIVIAVVVTRIFVAVSVVVLKKIVVVDA
jgi:hypothetical protein